MVEAIQKRKDQGFTIVEVMIVLAIAGLVILIVFLAVPALQRNSRNTQAKNEASNVMGATNEFVSNNNGKLPAVSVSSTATSDAGKIFALTKLQNITTIEVVLNGTATAPATDKAIISRGSKCVAPSVAGFVNDATIKTGGAARQFVVLYPMELSSGDATGCIES